MIEEARAPDPPVVERLARLFEAGDYPDKGLSVSEADLASMASGFGGPVPIRIEHGDGPLRLGWLVKVWVQGRELLGKLAFSRAAWELMRQCRASALSVGIDPRTLAIQEVSLVRRPRVTGAKVFADGAKAGSLAVFSIDLIRGGKMQVTGTSSGQARQDASGLLERLKSSGKVCPAAERYALALLEGGRSATIDFAEEGPVDAAVLFLRFIEAQPPVVTFGELAPAGAAKRRFSDDERRMFRAMGLSEEDVQAVEAGEVTE